jgi:hypothetical protein
VAQPAEDGVSDVVAHGVVDFFETVDVHHHEGEIFGPGPALGQEAVQKPPVAEPGKSVLLGRAGEATPPKWRAHVVIASLTDGGAIANITGLRFRPRNELGSQPLVEQGQALEAGRPGQAQAAARR